MNSNHHPSITQCSFKKMGTVIDLQIVVDNEQEYLRAQNDLISAQKLYEKYEQIFSRFLEDSELLKLNGKLNLFQPASKEMMEVAKLSLDYYKKSNKIFDPRIIQVLENAGYVESFENIGKTKIKSDQKIDFEMHLENDLQIFDDSVKFLRPMDFSGIAKGWATDKVADFFRQQGWKNFLVDSGGDMFFAGHDEKQKPWYIDIDNISHEKILFELSGKAIATSGIGKRKWEKEGKRLHHLIDSRNPDNFSFEIQSATVISSSVTEADVFAKTIFILGKEKGFQFAKEYKLPCVILNYDGSAWISPQTKKYLYDKKV